MKHKVKIQSRQSIIPKIGFFKQIKNSQNSNKINQREKK